MLSRPSNENGGIDRSRRRSYLVKSNLQARYAVMFILINAIGIAIGATSALIYPSSAAMSFVYGAYVVFMVCGIVVASVLFTNRVAGPVYRLEKTIDQILTDKHLDRVVRLRAGDELQGLAAKFTQLLQEWHMVTATDRARAEQIVHKLDQVKEYVETLPLTSQRKRILELLQESREGLTAIADAYSPEPPTAGTPPQTTGAAS